MILRDGGIIVRQERDEAPEITAIAAGEIATLKERLEAAIRELGYIANAKNANFESAEDFRDWAKSRARHAILNLMY